MACGSDFIAILSKSGVLYTIGENDHGQLGTKDKKSTDTPVEIKRR